MVNIIAGCCSGVSGLVRHRTVRKNIMFTSNALFVLCTLWTIIVSAVGAHFNIGGTSSVLDPAGVAQPESISSAWDLVTDTASFFWQTITFQLTDVPVAFSVFIIAPIGYIMLYLVLKLIRGVN